MPLLTGKSSQGSNPTTWFSFTLSWMPHCTPQKQQCVLTSLSASAAAPQPPGGVSARCGPYCSINCSTVCGSLAMAHRLFDHPGLRQAQAAALAARAEREVEVEADARHRLLQVLDVHHPGEALAAATADGRLLGVLRAVEDHGEVHRPLEDVEELAEGQVQQ